MQELVAWAAKATDEEALNPLLIVAIFVVVFLAIHPFQDGNGRLSRILTTLLLLRAGYAYVPYSSLKSTTPALSQATGADAVGISYRDAAPVLALLRDYLPEGLAAGSSGSIERAWPRWVAQRDAEIRARLARGDEDALVNLWLYGTTFTERPPARERELALLGDRPPTAAILEGRLEDLVAGIASPGSNERLRFARQVIERRGIDPATAAGRREVKQFLIDTRERVLSEFASTDRLLASARESSRQQNDPSFEIAAYSAIFKDRGVASDTSILPAFGVDQALALIASHGVLKDGSVRRVGIVGPGLDFVNKTDGYDFYPPQTIQPFAVVDSLMRLGLASRDGLQVTALDLNPRVGEHIEEAYRRAQREQPYVLQLPLVESERWDPGLIAYWKRLGERVGAEAAPIAPPAMVAGVAVRAVAMRPDIVRSIRARDLNIVLQRLEPLAPEEHFDLLVATNILVYYGPFEQSLALANAAAMLRPGGLLLVNSGVLPPPPLEPSAGYARVPYSDRQYDQFFWYRRESATR